jgi:hypothetical protein
MLGAIDSIPHTPSWSGAQLKLNWIELAQFKVQLLVKSKFKFKIKFLDFF